MANESNLAFKLEFTISYEQLIDGKNSIKKLQNRENFGMGKLAKISKSSVIGAWQAGIVFIFFFLQNVCLYVTLFSHLRRVWSFSCAFFR